MWTRAGMVDTGRIIAAVAHAYNAAFHPADDVTAAAIVGKSRTPAVALARHLCAYLFVEDYRLTNMAAARAVGRTDHTTVLNSRARVVAALGHDLALQRALAGARDILSGTARARPHRDHGRQDLAGATPRELAEYRYWRLRALRAGNWGGAR